MLHQATLGGLPGAGEVRSRRRTETSREYRGTFAFRSQHDPAMQQLLDSGDWVEYDGPVDDEAVKLKVRVTDVSFETGIASLLGSGEPYG